MTRRNIDLPDEVWQRLKIAAATEGITVKALVARFVEAGLLSSRPKRHRSPNDH